MAENNLSPQGYIITKDPVNHNPFWENEDYNPNASLPAGGTTGQVLTKKSATNFSAEWKDLPESATPSELAALSKELNAAIQQEVADREKADTALSQKIDGLNIPDVTQITQDVADNKTAIENEAKARQEADTALSQKIDALKIPDVTQLTQDVEGLETTVSGLSTEVANLKTSTEQNFEAVGQRVTDETTARSKADEALTTALSKEVTARENQYAGIKQVPGGGTVGQVLTKTETGEDWKDPTGGGSSYTLPQAATDTLGGVKADNKTEADTQPVNIDPTTGKLYTKPGGGGGSYTLPQATAGALGGVKADPATSEDTQPVNINSAGKLVTKPGTGGGGGSDPVLLASHGDISLMSLLGGTNLSSQLLKMAEGKNLFDEMGKFNSIGVSIITAVTSKGVLSAQFFNPYKKTGMKGNTKNFYHWFQLDVTTACKVDFTATDSTTYQPTIQVSFVNTNGGIATVDSVIGIAVYGVN